jgi:hypothetical protein
MPNRPGKLSPPALGSFEPCAARFYSVADRPTERDAGKEPKQLPSSRTDGPWLLDRLSATTSSFACEEITALSLARDHPWMFFFSCRPPSTGGQFLAECGHQGKRSKRRCWIRPRKTALLVNTCLGSSRLRQRRTSPCTKPRTERYLTPAQVARCLAAVRLLRVICAGKVPVT